MIFKTKTSSFLMFLAASLIYHLLICAVSNEMGYRVTRLLYVSVLWSLSVVPAASFRY